MNEYRNQTKALGNWIEEFQCHKSALSDDEEWFRQQRNCRIQNKYKDTVGEPSLTRGVSGVPCDLIPVFETRLPASAKQCVCIWVCNGWDTEEAYVRAEAIQAGNQSPVVFAFIPQCSANEFRQHLIDEMAAARICGELGLGFGNEDAHKYMTAIREKAKSAVNKLLDDAFSHALVLQGGGNELTGSGLRDVVRRGAENAMLRLYPKFSAADKDGWPAVYNRASKGIPDALNAIGDTGKPEENPVCSAILDFISGGKNGADVHHEFELPPYGWPRDAVDGGLQVLLVAGLVRAQDERARTLDPKTLERKQIGQTLFRPESVTVSAPQLAQIRQLFEKMGIKAAPGEEVFKTPEFMDKLEELTSQAGGDAPRPAVPDTSLLSGFGCLPGNEGLLALHEQRVELGACIDRWNSLAKRISERLPGWNELQRLVDHASGLDGADLLLSQAHSIKEQRLLIDEPDPVRPLIGSLGQLLREKLEELVKADTDHHAAGNKRLAGDCNWQQLEPRQKNQLLTEEELHQAAHLGERVRQCDDVLDILMLEGVRLPHLIRRVESLPDSFTRVAERAAELIEDKEG